MWHVLTISRFSLARLFSFSSSFWIVIVKSSFLLPSSLFLSSRGLHCFSDSRTRFSWCRERQHRDALNRNWHEKGGLQESESRRLEEKKERRREGTEQRGSGIFFLLVFTSSFRSSTSSVLRSSNLRIVELSSAMRLWFLRRSWNKEKYASQIRLCSYLIF